MKFRILIQGEWCIRVWVTGLNEAETCAALMELGEYEREGAIVQMLDSKSVKPRWVRVSDRWDDGVVTLHLPEEAA